MPNNPRAIFFSYCLQKLEDGRYVVLNRNYKPLGFTTDEFVIYEDFPISVRFKSLTQKKAAKLSIHKSEELDTIYLYDDRSIPTLNATTMKNYLARLALLANMEFVDTQR